MGIAVGIIQSTVIIIVVHTIHELLHIYIQDRLKGLVQDTHIGTTLTLKTIALKRNSVIIKKKKETI